MVRLTALVLLLSTIPPTPLLPAKGMFLVAKPEIDGGPFHRSVVLLLYHDERGTLGVIVNRTTEIPVGEALPELEGKAFGHQLFFGGPVALSGLLFVFRSTETPEGADANAVVGNIYFSGDRERLETLLDGGKPVGELNLFLGHSGWSKGQLDAEILRGSWDVLPADASQIFEMDRDTMWSKLSKSGLSARLSSLDP